MAMCIFMRVSLCLSFKAAGFRVQSACRQQTEATTKQKRMRSLYNVEYMICDTIMYNHVYIYICIYS